MVHKGIIRPIPDRPLTKKEENDSVSPERPSLDLSPRKKCGAHFYEYIESLSFRVSGSMYKDTNIAYALTVYGCKDCGKEIYLPIVESGYSTDLKEYNMAPLQ